MESEPQPKQHFLIQDLEQLQAIADPLRQRLLEHLSQQAMTVTQLANLLEEKPNRLYYHVNKLEQLGLVQLVETRPNRGILEKYYQAVAKEFTVDNSLFRLQQPTEEITASLYQVMRAAFESTLQDLRQTLRLKGQNAPERSTEKRALLHGVATRARLPREKAKEFSEKVVSLCQEFEAADDPEGDVEYQLTLLWLPLSKGQEKDAEEVEG